MINTSKYSKGLIIFLVYNIIMIISTVSCNFTDPPNTSDTNKVVPDYDMIRIDDERDYFKYYFRPSEYVGQLKVLPKTFFASVYILPDLNDPYDYNAYKGKFQGGNFKLILDYYNQFHKTIKKQEDFYVDLFKKSFEAARNAHDAVKKYEDPAEKYNKDLNKTLKDNAIENYLNTQMPDIPKEMFPNAYWGNELRYIYDNYEVHADPTKEVFYRSSIIEEEFNVAKFMTDYYHVCNPLNDIEYHEVMFLNNFISITMDNQFFFTESIDRTYATIPIEMQFDVMNEPKGGKPRYSDDYRSETKRLQNKFAVNNENYISYLVRLKIMGYIGFSTKYLASIYRTRKDFESNGLRRYFIDMDINTDIKLSEYSELKPLEEYMI